MVGDSLITFQELKYDADGRATSSFLHHAASANPKPPAVMLPSDGLGYDEDNQLSTWNSATANVAFDHDGNMTTGPLPSGTLSTYAYDSRNRLTSAGGSAYRYSPDGLRVQITGTGAATFVIDPNATLSRALMRTQNGTTTYYVYGLGLLYEETGSSTSTYHFDQVGSTIALTNDSQAVTDRWSYSPYGTVTRDSGSTNTPFLYNGELGVQTDANGLYHMRARYYNPRLMRFVNADPIGFDGGLNWYAAFGNDPISNTDPSGQYIAPVHFLATFTAEVAHGNIFSAIPVAWASVRTDFRDLPGGIKTQSSNYLATSMHAMAGKLPDGTPQTTEQAYQSTQAAFRQSLRNANDPTASRSDRSQSMGDAYHIAQDSQVHRYAFWSGGFGGFSNAVVHIFHDTILSPVNIIRLLVASFKVQSGGGLAKLPEAEAQNSNAGGRK